MPKSVAENLEAIKNRINEACLRVHRDPKEVTIIAVTKYVSNMRAIEAREAGLNHFGENYEEGILKKYEEIKSDVIWHFIGTLQSRKVKNIIDKVDYIHSLDRLSLAKEINKRASKAIQCFIQINVSNEPSKHGIQPHEVVSFVKTLKDYPMLKIVGLMTMAPNTNDQDVVRFCFHNLKKLAIDVQALGLSYAPCTELSMGMSNDFEIAIEEGATFIRIGTALVGKEF